MKNKFIKNYIDNHWDYIEYYQGFDNRITTDNRYINIVLHNIEFEKINMHFRLYITIDIITNLIEFYIFDYDTNNRYKIYDYDFDSDTLYPFKGTLKTNNLLISKLAGELDYTELRQKQWYYLVDQYINNNKEFIYIIIALRNILIN